jgi:hypothetical protein
LLRSVSIQVRSGIDWPESYTTVSVSLLQSTRAMGIIGGSGHYYELKRVCALDEQAQGRRDGSPRVLRLRPNGSLDHDMIGLNAVG